MPLLVAFVFLALALAVLLLAVPREAAAQRLARLWQAQERWAEMMDRRGCPLARPLSTGPSPGRSRLWAGSARRCGLEVTFLP
jgi:hypothetical protein